MGIRVRGKSGSSGGVYVLVLVFERVLLESEVV